MKKILFVDGGYLNFLAHGKILDFQEIARGYAEAHYYTSAPNPKKEDFTKSFKGFEKVLRKAGFVPHIGTLRYKDGEWHQKRVDVDLATDMVLRAASGGGEEIYLLSGDEDFVPAVLKTEKMGTTVTVLHGPRNTVSGDLLDSASKSFFLDDAWFRERVLRGRRKR